MQPSSPQTNYDDSIDEYGAWTDPTYVPEAKKPKKKTGAMRWLDPEWSIVRTVRNWIYDDEDEDDHMHNHGQPMHHPNQSNDFIPHGVPSDVLP